MLQQGDATCLEVWSMGAVFMGAYDSHQYPASLCSEYFVYHSRTPVQPIEEHPEYHRLRPGLRESSN